jgi:hypothetical protein
VNGFSLTSFSSILVNRSLAEENDQDQTMMDAGEAMFETNVEGMVPMDLSTANLRENCTNSAGYQNALDFVTVRITPKEYCIWKLGF